MSTRARRAGGLLLVWALSACASEPAASSAPVDVPPPPKPLPEVENWAAHVAEQQSGDARVNAHQVEVRSAVMPDEGEDSEQHVTARRLVYRVNFVVPPVFRDRHGLITGPAGELHVDLSLTRLRARFMGPGWPLPEGSELRLRIDVHGAYVFDGLGGRSLGAGEIASWFEGRAGDRRSQSNVRVRREYGATATDDESPAEMMCILLSEWTNQDRGLLARRCAGGAIPPGFRFGPWSAELTAVVPLELPRYALRADEADPASEIVSANASMMLDESGIARITPSRPALQAEGEEGEQEAEAKVALTVHNRSDVRVIVIVQGVPVAWIDAGSSLVLPGFTPGSYRVGAIRPFGVLRMSPRFVQFPGEITVGRP